MLDDTCRKGGVTFMLLLGVGDNAVATESSRKISAGNSSPVGWARCPNIDALMSGLPSLFGDCQAICVQNIS